MINVKYDEPNDKAWRDWRDTGIARHTSMKEKFAFGAKPKLDDDLYKQMRSFLLARFHNKCAYCETSIVRYTVDVEHYRPKGRVTNADRKIVKVVHKGKEYDHPGYFWHVYDWKNLLPSCEFCNRKRYHEAQDATWGKETCFPVESDAYAWPWDKDANERPLLIHPRLDEPGNHLTFIRGEHPNTHAKFCCVQGKDTRGETTIRVLGLNDERLNEPRLDAYADGYQKLTDVFDLIRAFRDATAEGKIHLRQQLQGRTEEVDRVWYGEKPYTAFGRLGILDCQAELAKVQVTINVPFKTR